ncbi:hypothetical protein ACFL96_17075, partial [Thermoproteota archaeon]
MKTKHLFGSRKAFLFTLSFLFVTFALLAFAKFIAYDSENDKLIFQTMALTNRLDETDSSLQECIREALFEHSNINVSLDSVGFPGNNILIIEEPLPNSAG